jgi:hypothetical protein
MIPTSDVLCLFVKWFRLTLIFILPQVANLSQVAIECNNFTSALRKIDFKLAFICIQLESVF